MPRLGRLPAVISGIALCTVAPGVLFAADDAARLPRDDTMVRPAADLAHASRATELAVLLPADGVTVAAMGPSVDVPWILSPLVRGSGGLQALWTVRDQREVLVRLGAGAADVQSTGRAPPFQRPPDRSWNFDGTEVAWRFEEGEFYGSMQRRNWGPGWTGSLILDGAAQPVAALGWRRPLPRASEHPWLRWMGPWSADVFFGRLAGHDTPERPELIGMRLQLQPWDFLQIGLSRTMQWGGRGREESLRSLLRGLLGEDNVGSHGITKANEPGNQLAGFDWRVRLGADEDNAFYGQAIGEDEDGGLPSAYIAQFGLQAHARLLGVEWLGFVEWNDLIAAHVYQGTRPPGITYTSAVFKQGYTNDHMPLGHPAGGDVTMASVGVLARVANLALKLVASHGDALPTAQRFAPGSFSGVNGSLRIDIDARQQIGAAAWWWRDAAERQRALQLWFSYRL